MTARSEPHQNLDVGLLRSWMEAKKDAMVADLHCYVDLESPSDDLLKLEVTLRWLEERIEQLLGTPSRRRWIEQPGHAPTLVLDWPGEGDTVLLLAHYDTVWPAGSLSSMPFEVDGDIIRGPGVFDMKAGLIQAVWALRGLIEAGLGRPPIRLVLNGDEEIGSVGSRMVIQEACTGAAMALVFEGSADGAVKTGRKGVGLFRIEVIGEAAHAGLDPTGGANAVVALAHLILELHELADLSKGTSVNVGVVSGGSRANVIAARAQARVDVRVEDPGEMLRIDAALSSLDPHNQRIRVEVYGKWNRPIMPRTRATAALYHRAKDLAAAIGVDLQERSVGGASDGNFAAAQGLPVLDGIGAVGSGAHARHEYATISGMVERAALAAAFIATCASVVSS